MAVTLAEAIQWLDRSRKAAPDRRRFRRVPTALNGRYMTRSGTEVDCRTIDISPGNARIASSELPEVGETLVVYLARIGRVEGAVARILDEGSFAVSFTSGRHKREKIADELTLLINPGLDLVEDRRQSRHEGGGGALVELPDGTSIHGEIVDFSLSGVAIRTARPRPIIGAWVRVGGQYGKVARYIEQGFAIDFTPNAKR